MSNQASTDRFFKLGVGFLAWGVLLWGLSQLAQSILSIVILFGLAVMFTYILLAPVNAMDVVLSRIGRIIRGRIKFSIIRSLRFSPKLSRALAILLVYLAFTLTMLMVSVRFVPVVMDQLLQFSNELPQYLTQVEEWAFSQPLIQQYFHQEIAALKSRGELTKPQEKQIEQEAQGHEMPQGKLSPTEKQVIHEKLFSTTEYFNQFIKEHLGGTLGNFLRVLGNTLTGLVYTLTGLVLVFYFLLDAPELKDGFLDMLPPESQPAANYLLSNIHSAMFGFIKGQVMLGMATGVYMIIIYSIFGVPYAFFLGAFFAVAEILPVVGTWLGFLPGILVLLFISPVKLLAVMGFVYIFQVIKDNVVAPRILGQVMGLHPVIVILSLLICAKVAGLVGVLFAIPLASIINVMIRYFQHHETRNYQV